MRIDGYDELMSNVRDGTFAQVYTWDIANESLNYDIMPRYWVICE